MGFADGALRLLPGWLEFERLRLHAVAEHRPRRAWSCCRSSSLSLGAYPFLERWVTGDNREHHLLDRPRNAPVRTGIGMAGDHVLLRALVRRAATTSWRSSSDCRSTTSPGSSGSRCSSCRRIVFVGHQADLPGAAAPRPRDRAARPRDRHASCARPTASSSSGTSRRAHARALGPRPARGRRADRARGRRRRRTASRAGGQALESGCGPACRGSTSPTRSTRSPRPSSPRPQHHDGRADEAIEPSASRWRARHRGPGGARRPALTGRSPTRAAHPPGRAALVAS